MTRFDQILLPFGLVIAAVALAYWAVRDYDLYRRVTDEGLVRATFVLGAVGVLALVLRLAQWVNQRPGDGQHRS